MHTIRFHGRGGQGAKISAHILARAAYYSGYFTQDFALYGAERKGAPIQSFVRISKEPIVDRGYVYAPQYVIVLDDSIPDKVLYQGAGKKAVVLKNVSNPKKEGEVDATSIAFKITGTLFVNVAMLGYLLRKLDFIPFKNLEKAIKFEFSRYSKKVIQKNIETAKKLYEMV